MWERQFPSPYDSPAWGNFKLFKNYLWYLSFIKSTNFICSKLIDWPRTLFNTTFNCGKLQNILISELVQAWSYLENSEGSYPLSWKQYLSTLKTFTETGNIFRKNRSQDSAPHPCACSSSCLKLLLLAICCKIVPEIPHAFKRIYMNANILRHIKLWFNYVNNMLSL